MEKKINSEVFDKNTQSNVKMNSLRAAVLGANDGIVSVAGIVAGVAGATHVTSTIFTAGIAGLVAGALSMAAGEYISVSSQRDSERAMIEKEKFEIDNHPEEELKELTFMYQQKGLSTKTAKIVAEELTKSDAYAAHIDIELGIDPDDLTNPLHASIASAISFTIGALIPLITIISFSAKYRLLATFISVFIALVVTGAASAHIGGAKKLPATIRVTLGGLVAMAITYGIGHIVGINIH